MRPIWRVAVLVLVIVAVTCIGSLAVSLDSWLDPFDDQPFSQAAWMNTKSSDDRAPMTRDLIRNHLHAGSTVAQIETLLGPPDRFPGRDNDSSVDGFGNEMRGSATLCYSIGSWSSLSWYGFDSAFLYIHFDNDHRLIFAEINGG